MLTCTPEVSKKYNLKNLKEYLLFVHDIHKREESKTIVVSDQGKVIVDHIFKNIKIPSYEVEDPKLSTSYI